jgi:type II secretory pathway component PulF
MSVRNMYSRLKAYLPVFTSLVLSVSLVLSALLFLLVSLVLSASVARIFRFFGEEVGTSLAVLHILKHIEPKQDMTYLISSALCFCPS